MQIGASYSRYSSDLQDESSLEQQKRKCRDRAAADSIPLPIELEFSDSAVSGTKRERAGLSAMLEAAEAGKFQVLYFESLSRLARESIITMPMLKDLVYNHRIRIVSVSEGIDSSVANWDLTASFMSWVHEVFLKNLRSAVLRGQEHAVMQDWSCGDWCFGYASEPIPGSEAGRRGRHPRPRMRVVINPEHAEWVRQIFHWFVIDGWKMDRITRELTIRNAPKDHRSSKPGWHHDYVKRVLRNSKYIGIWPWGKATNMRDPLTGDIYQEGRTLEEVAQWTRLRPGLRIVEDNLFARAQVLLDENERKWLSFQDEKGKFNQGRPKDIQSKHLLQGLIKCGECGGTFQVCGAHGKYLGCSRAKRGLCNCGTFLPRELAEKRLLELVGNRILEDQKWLDAVVAESLHAWSERKETNPSERDSLVARIEEDRAVERRLSAAIGKLDEGADALIEELRERMRTRKEKELRLALLQAEVITPASPPTRDWIASEMRRLVEVLQDKGPAANLTLRKLLGGRVTVRETRSEGRKQPYFVSTVSLRVRQLFDESPAATDSEELPSSPGLEPVEIEFREARPWAALADAVKEKIDAGVKYRKIAELLGCHPTWVPKALACWFRSRGLPAPDGRTMRSRLDRPSLADQLSDQIMQLWDTGRPMQEIAQELGCSRDIVTECVRNWFESRGLPVPDGRERRREVNAERRLNSERTDGVAE